MLGNIPNVLDDSVADARRAGSGIRADVLRLAALGAGIAIAYILAAHVGFRLAFVAEQITTVWAPIGIAIAALLLWGIRLWPAVWLGRGVELLPLRLSASILIN